MKRLTSYIEKYLEAVDLEDKASNEGNSKAEERAIDKQFMMMEKISEFTKTKVKAACKVSENKRVKSFFNMYMK